MNFNFLFCCKTYFVVRCAFNTTTEWVHCVYVWPPHSNANHEKLLDKLNQCSHNTVPVVCVLNLWISIHWPSWTGITKKHSFVAIVNAKRRLMRLPVVFVAVCCLLNWSTKNSRSSQINRLPNSINGKKTRQRHDMSTQPRVSACSLRLSCDEVNTNQHSSLRNTRLPSKSITRSLTVSTCGVLFIH